MGKSIWWKTDSGWCGYNEDCIDKVKLFDEIEKEGHMITIKDKERIGKGISAYQEMQDDILNTIKKHGGNLTEDEFDNEFGGFNRPLTGQPMRGDSFVLGGINGDHNQQKYLDLAHHMIILGIISAKTIDGKVVYSIKEAS